MNVKKKFDTHIPIAIDLLIKYLAEAKVKNRGNVIYLRPRKIARYYRIRHQYQKLVYCLGLVLEELLYHKVQLDIYRIHMSRVYALSKDRVDKAIQVLEQIKSFYLAYGALPSRLLGPDQVASTCGGSES